MGSAKNKKAPKQSKPGRPPKKSKTSEATPVDKQSTKSRPKPKPPRTPAAHASQSDGEKNDTSQLDVDMLPEDVVAATEGLLGLAKGKKGQETVNGLDGYGEVLEVAEEDADEENGEERGALDPEGTESSSNS